MFYSPGQIRKVSTKLTFNARIQEQLIFKLVITHELKVDFTQLDFI